MLRCAANTRSLAWRMTSDGTAYTRFRRSIEVRSVSQAEMAIREMPRVGLLDALDFCTLLAADAPNRYEPAARRWLSLLLAECESLTLDDVQLAVACLRSLPAGDIDPIRDTLRALVERRHRLRGQ
jgi:hypothetical protein